MIKKDTKHRTQAYKTASNGSEYSEKTAVKIPAAISAAMMTAKCSLA